MNKTITPSLETIQRNWFLVDAKYKTLGRLATEIATVLRGKNKPTFTPHLDTGDFVIVVNVGLFLPLNTVAISVASLPSVLSFASTKNQFLSMVSKDGVIVLFIYQIYANKFKVSLKFYLIGGILNNSSE